MKKLTIAIILTFTLSGCIGQNALFNKVIDWNLDASDNKFVQEGIFIALNIIIPIPSIALGLDYLIFNSIEFWTGENAISGEMSVHGTAKVFHGEDGSVTIATLNKDDTISFNTTLANGEQNHMVLAKTETEVILKDHTGQILARGDKGTILR